MQNKQGVGYPVVEDVGAFAMRDRLLFAKQHGLDAKSGRFLPFPWINRPEQCFPFALHSTTHDLSLLEKPRKSLAIELFLPSESSFAFLNSSANYRKAYNATSRIKVLTSSFATGFTPLQRKPLELIIDIERAKNKSTEELADIWDDYHLGRGHIGVTMKATLYHLLNQRAADCRYFVIPMWKGNGYTTMFLQVQMPHMLFTGLEDYKARGTQAAPYFTASYYTEFAESKDLVLIRGDIVFTSKLTDSEAKWLLETAQSFYLNDVRYKLVERFNKEPREFEFKDVLQALDMPVL
ncbi:unnamed protein product [Fraxinus pennsylvanica]|uniref:ATP synthase mitochondrial F1 complex assembly factor 1 n=1 Tax=Fraxinus pennsylvanica TaxID=56036 RepID=A0AAD2E1Y0_9LAMI|nr:unnamed protein product [Fraxinus pennsylvanica]